jgi:hypothetical protein
LQFIVIAAVKIEDKRREFIVRGWIFFSFSILILLICLFLLFYSYKDEYCKYYLNKGSTPDYVIEKSEARLLITMSEDEENNKNINDSEKQQIETIDNEYKKEKEMDANLVKVVPSFCYVFKKMWDLEILITLCYVVTFFLFPNASIVQKVFNIGEYNSVTIIAIYNALDTVGRYIVNSIKPSKKLDLIILIGRVILIFTIIFNYYCQERLNTSLTTTSILIIIYVALLGITNGIGATLTFGLASARAEDEIKEQVGNSIGFFCILGIFLGSVLAFGSGAIIDAIKKK